MTLVFTIGKIAALLSCGWSAPCAIAFAGRDLVVSLQRLWNKTIY